jgi:hypothetical protein
MESFGKKSPERAPPNGLSTHSHHSLKTIYGAGKFLGLFTLFLISTPLGLRHLLKKGTLHLAVFLCSRAGRVAAEAV